MVKPSASNPLDSLVDLACRDGVDVRPTLLRVVTDLYVQKPNHSTEEETQFVELALGLIEAVDAQNPNTVALMRGPLAMFAVGNLPSHITRPQLLAATAASRLAGAGNGAITGSVTINGPGSGSAGHLAPGTFIAAPRSPAKPIGDAHDRQGTRGISRQQDRSP